MTHWARVPALNTDALFIEDMSDLVEEALSAPSLSVYEAMPLNSNDLVHTHTHSTFTMQVSSLLDHQSEAIVLNQPSPSFGITEAAEKLNGRFAILGILGTTLLEVVGGHPVLQMVSLCVPPTSPSTC